MFKRLFFLFVLVMSSYLIQAQIADPRLLTIYSQDYLDDISENHPNELRYLNWYLDNSFSILELGVDKCQHLPFLKYIDPETKQICGNVDIVDVQNFNIYMYSFERFYDKKSVYRIGSTGFAIAFDSEKKLAENYNKYQYGK